VRRFGLEMLYESTPAECRGEPNTITAKDVTRLSAELDLYRAKYAHILREQEKVISELRAQLPDGRAAADKPAKRDWLRRVRGK